MTEPGDTQPKPLPNIFIAHQGRQQYFLDALAAAARFGSVHVIDLGRTEPPDSEQYERMQSAYVHLAGNSVTFELHWCLRRYFLLCDDFKRFGIEAGWLLDSDVIIVGALPSREEFSEGAYCALSMQRHEHPLAQNASAHCSWWTLDALEDFCRFAFDLYVDRSEELVALDEARRTHGIRAGISDMIVLYLWAKDNPRVFDTHRYTSGLIDHNIRILEQPYGVPLQGDAGNKALLLCDGDVFCLTRDGQRVAMRSLHFQGKNKVLIPHFVRGQMAAYAAKAHGRRWIGEARLALRRIRESMTRSRFG
jgi:hypothetical protein